MPSGYKADGTPSNFRHGQSKTPEYIAYNNMLQRCLNQKHPRYHQYGGRGMKVCERWRESIANFLADMGRKPSADLTLDRIDPTGHYEPANCRWISFDENRLNRRSQYRITEAERQRRRDMGAIYALKAVASRKARKLRQKNLHKSRRPNQSECKGLDSQGFVS